MAFLQKCNACGSEYTLNDISERYRICPNPQCRSRVIAHARPVEITEGSNNEGDDGDTIHTQDTESLSEETIQVVETEDIMEEDYSAMFEEMREMYREINTVSQSTISFKYISGRIPGEFSIEIKSVDAPVSLGRECTGSKFLEVDSHISRRHMTIYYEDSVWKIEDNKSSNGVMIDSERIAAGVKVPVKDGSIVKLGHTSDSAKFLVTVK